MHAAEQTVASSAWTKHYAASSIVARLRVSGLPPSDHTIISPLPPTLCISLSLFLNPPPPTRLLTPRMSRPSRRCLQELLGYPRCSRTPQPSPRWTAAQLHERRALRREASAWREMRR